MSFEKWLDTLIEEKGIYPEFECFEVEGKSGTNWIPLECVLDAIKRTSKAEQEKIRTMLVKIDFQNGNILDYFKHLARAIAI